MERTLRTTTSYEQLIEELECLKKRLLHLENCNQEDYNNLEINDYPALHRLASGSEKISRQGESNELPQKYISEIINLKAKLLKETQEKEHLKLELIKANSHIEDLENKNNKIKRRSEKLFTITKQLKSANADLENFIYSSSHDLRSPISNLEGLIQILKNELGNKIGKSELTLMQMISTSIARFKQTIFDLTELSSFQKQAGEVQEPIMFEEVLNDVKSSINNKIKESGAEIETEFNVSEIQFARKNIRSVIFNLLINAVKYRSPGRPLKIKLSSRKIRNTIIFEIEDNGLGFLPDQKDKLFQMFKRLHTHVDGTGVGLYIVKKIIENNGGRIEVESEINKGSKFKIFFKL